MNDVIGQEKAKHAIAAAIYQHKLACDNPWSKLPQTNIFLCGNSGCGKTYMANKAADAAGFNTFTINCSILTGEGYRGLNLSQALYNNYKSCGVGRANFGKSVIILDEFDKIIDSYLRDSRGASVFDFLPLLDGKYKLDLSAFRESGFVDLSKCMFILTGTCYGAKQHKTRKNKEDNKITIGFENSGTICEDDINSEILTVDDLIDYGCPNEIIGRISQVININPLNKDDIEKIITNSSDSPFNKYKSLFDCHDVYLRITETAKEKMAEKIAREQTGARAISSAFENLLFPEIENVCQNEDIGELVISYSRSKGVYVKQKYRDSSKPRRISQLDL